MGLFSKQPLLPDEDPAEYESCATDCSRPSPLTVLAEELLVDEIVSLLWRLRTAPAGRGGPVHHRQPRPVLEALRRSGEADAAVGSGVRQRRPPNFNVLSRYEVSLVQPTEAGAGRPGAAPSRARDDRHQARRHRAGRAEHGCFVSQYRDTHGAPPDPTMRHSIAGQEEPSDNGSVSDTSPASVSVLEASDNPPSDRQRPDPRLRRQVEGEGYRPRLPLGPPSTSRRGAMTTASSISQQPLRRSPTTSQTSPAWA